MLIAHIDMDCFFCSCEIKRSPKFAGKPVIVGSTGNRGVVSAANYEARKFGVFSATPISKARILCPDGVYLGVDKKYYFEESKKIMKLLNNVSTEIQQVSVDEAYLELTEYAERFDSFEDMALSIKKMIQDECDLSCSIGIAESKIVAKIASDFKKPGGITIVRDAKEFLAPLVIEKIPGIGRVSKKYYHEQGIHTIGDLAELSRARVVEMFGKHALFFHDISLGKERSQIKSHRDRKSISRETTFFPDINSKSLITDELSVISHRVFKDLGKKYFKTVGIKVRFSDFTTITRDITLPIHCRSFLDIRNNAMSLLDEIPSGKIRLLGVRLSKLISGKEVQTTLLEF